MTKRHHREKNSWRNLLLCSVAGIGLCNGLPPAVAATVSPSALPSGGTLTSGSATISQNGTKMDINQLSNTAIMNWQSFNIGSQSQVNFNQPNSSSVFVNRVISSDASQIFGKLTANGQIILINPNGMVFGAGSVVDTGGLIASVLDVKDADILAGKLSFQRDGATGSIINQGTL